MSDDCRECLTEEQDKEVICKCCVTTIKSDSLCVYPIEPESENRCGGFQIELPESDPAEECLQVNCLMSNDRLKLERNGKCIWITAADLFEAIKNSTDQPNACL